MNYGLVFKSLLAIFICYCIYHFWSPNQPGHVDDSENSIVEKIDAVSKNDGEANVNNNKDSELLTVDLFDDKSIRKYLISLSARDESFNLSDNEICSYLSNKQWLVRGAVYSSYFETENVIVKNKYLPRLTNLEEIRDSLDEKYHLVFPHNRELKNKYSYEEYSFNELVPNTIFSTKMTAYNWEDKRSGSGIDKSTLYGKISKGSFSLARDKKLVISNSTGYSEEIFIPTKGNPSKRDFFVTRSKFGDSEITTLYVDINILQHQ